MYNPQVKPIKTDIEKGDKEDICQSNAGNSIDHTSVARNSGANFPIVVGLQYCCCDTRQGFQYEYEEIHTIRIVSKSSFPN